MQNNNIHDYDDIINLPHHCSIKHPPMSNMDRSAQFAPFAALTGHKEAINETGRVTDEKKSLDEHKKILLNEVLQEILLHIKQRPIIKVTYFEVDSKKQGGTYKTITKNIKRIDEVYQILIFTDSTEIRIDDISEIAYIV